jgi:hypothetical protein
MCNLGMGLMGLNLVKEEEEAICELKFFLMLF